MAQRPLLILGRTGQLARALAAAAASRRLAVICAGRDAADLSRPGAVSSFIGASRPHAVINAAAFTGVDDAETDTAAAWRVNAEAAGEAAEAARRIGARFIHVSTDYVFGGDGRSGPFSEDDAPSPVNAYGRSKLAGEQRVREADPGAAIVRTSAVFSGHGTDFPSTMWRMAGERDVLTVVEDQLTTPTYAGDLAKILLALASAGDAAGVFHAAGTPGVSWSGFAQAVLACSASADGPASEVRPVPTRDFPRHARRPADSRLTGDRVKQATGLEPSDWRAALPRALDVWRSER